MMVLIFEDDGYVVTTSAWSAAAKPGRQAVICYAWGAGGYSLVSSATGIARITLPITIEEFNAILLRSKSDVVDLRDRSAG